MDKNYSGFDLIFKGGFQVTQFYGENIAYYKQVSNGNLQKGHEGLDLIPANTDIKYWTIYHFDNGVVIKDIDNPRDGGVYGNTVVIWNKEKKEAWWYCHNGDNVVSVGDQIVAGQRVATMGSTGNVSGPHCHLNYVQTDDKANRINTNNGQLGYIDPLPRLLQFLDINKPMGKIQIESEVFEKLVGKSTKWDQIHKYLELSGDPKDTSFEDAQRVVAGYKSRVTDLQNQLAKESSERQNREEQVGRLKTQVTESEKLQEALQSKLTEAMKSIGSTQTVYEDRIKVMQGQIDEAGKQKGKLNTQISELKMEIENLKQRPNGGGSISAFDAFFSLFGSVVSWLKTIPINPRK
jgi:hypothetical protein